MPRGSGKHALLHMPWATGSGTLAPAGGNTSCPRSLPCHLGQPVLQESRVRTSPGLVYSFMHMEIS